ncbi:hypothetical protein MWQ35_003667 [Escherichia coli]|nr:hypothetical protein [Escherichia coli]EHW7993207.1 hypothetical protein [Escherichia coli]EJA1684522.1 hypothetical protein [Escherichia coli]EKE0799951.1 hypothetical protein [Escherichia coli]EKM0546109.1 hypothetical protein [Escherichia coli]
MWQYRCVDPIELAGGLNLYQYAPNPLSWIDPGKDHVMLLFCTKQFAFYV